jgi:Kef-type K+ transport system membrane component KefB
MIEATFFRDLAYVFSAAVVGGGVAKVLRQPLILGYVLGGFFIALLLPVRRFRKFINLKSWRRSESSS